EQQRHNAGGRQHQGHPQSLHVGRTDRRKTLAAEVLGDDRIERAGRAHEADEYGEVDTEPEPQGGQIDGRGVATQHGIDDGERHRGELSDEDRPRLTQDAADDGIQRRVTYRNAPRCEKRVSWLVMNSSSAACPPSVALRARPKAAAMSSGRSTRSLQPPIARAMSAYRPPMSRAPYLSCETTRCGISMAIA